MRRDEILRYAGVRGDAPPETRALLQTCRAKASEVLSYKLCFARFPCRLEADGIDLGFAKTDSKDLARALGDCDSILLLAATVGLGIDRLIAAHTLRSPSAAVLLQAIGSERVEALCDAFCREQDELLSKEGCRLRPRFSPGYGDLPLSLQADIFSALDCPKHVGISLGENLLMTPQKSVTAIIGIHPSYALRSRAN